MKDRNLLGLYFAEDDGSGSGGGSSATDDASKKAAEGGTTTDEKRFTQAELDKIVSDRVKREQKAFTEKLEDEKKKAALTESERLKAEKEEAEKHSKDSEIRANSRVIKAEAKVQALALGVKPERLDYALKLADLSAITVGDDGEPDATLIKAAIDKVLTDLPELKSGAQAGKSGTDFSGGNGLLGNDALEKMSMAEYAEYRRKQKAK